VNRRRGRVPWPSSGTRPCRGGQGCCQSKAPDVHVGLSNPRAWGVEDPIGLEQAEDVRTVESQWDV
jgi:hypothetical protein